jgi:hypothetical protein
MTVELIELLVGLYFIGVSISIVNRVFTVDAFKLGFGVVLVVFALMQGVQLI